MAEAVIAGLGSKNGRNAWKACRLGRVAQDERDRLERPGTEANTGSAEGGESLGGGGPGHTRSLEVRSSGLLDMESRGHWSAARHTVKAKRAQGRDESH